MSAIHGKPTQGLYNSYYKCAGRGWAAGAADLETLCTMARPAQPVTSQIPARSADLRCLPKAASPQPHSVSVLFIGQVRSPGSCGDCLCVCPPHPHPKRPRNVSEPWFCLLGLSQAMSCGSLTSDECDMYVSGSFCCVTNTQNVGAYNSSDFLLCMMVQVGKFGQFWWSSWLTGSLHSARGSAGLEGPRWPHLHGHSWCWGTSVPLLMAPFQRADQLLYMVVPWIPSMWPPG